MCFYQGMTRRDISSKVTNFVVHGLSPGEIYSVQLLTKVIYWAHRKMLDFSKNPTKMRCSKNDPKCTALLLRNILHKKWLVLSQYYKICFNFETISFVNFKLKNVLYYQIIFLCHYNQPKNRAEISFNIDLA